MINNMTGTTAAASPESSTSSTPPTQDDAATAPETPPSADNPDGTGSGSEDAAAEGDLESNAADMFPRSYVERLRRESAGYREQANTAGQLAQRLHTELVRATGRLADPSDLPFDQEHLDDANALTDAIDSLLARKPHLASRRPTGDIGQGASGSKGTVDLAGLLRARA